MEEASRRNEGIPLMNTRHRCCCKNICPNSKAALVILLWNSLVSLTYNFIAEPGIVLKLRVSGYHRYLDFYSVLAPFGTTVLLAVFYPLSGLLGDVKCGHFKMIKKSFFLLMFMPFPFAAYGSSLLLPNAAYKFVTIVTVVNGLATLVTLIGFVMYLANILPFAMDQLRDLPSKDSLLFIYWFVWTNYVSMLISQLVWDVIVYPGLYKSNSIPGMVLLIVISITVTFLFLLSVCYTVCCRSRWFKVEPGSTNPYRLVYEVMKFAWKHKMPVNRSAFTYCEDIKPSRLDLGKNKYGGPFTSEQVEDVKVFIGVLKILLCFGPVFVIDFATNSLFPLFSSHLKIQHNGSSAQNLSSLELTNAVLLQNESLSSLVIVIASPFCFYSCIPLVLRNHCGLRILRRMEISMILNLLNSVFLLAVDIVAHFRNDQLGCMLDIGVLTSADAFTSLQSTLLFTTQQILSAISNFMINVSCLEFICAQSPHSMKGMLIGLFYSIKGFFQFIGAATVIPFYSWKIAYFSCGFGYYSVNILLATMTFLVFVWAAKWYKYRERDEISREREFAENYYSQAPQEMQYSSILDMY